MLACRIHLIVCAKDILDQDGYSMKNSSDCALRTFCVSFVRDGHRVRVDLADGMRRSKIMNTGNVRLSVNGFSKFCCPVDLAHGMRRSKIMNTGNVRGLDALHVPRRAVCW